MGLPGVGGLISGLLAGPDASPSTTRPNLSGVSITIIDASGQVSVIRFDVVSQETHEALIAITDHPVEIGANVTDNARVMPESITIEGYVTNSPMASNPNVTRSLQSVPLDVQKVGLKPSLASLTNALGSALGDLLSPPPSGALLEKGVGDYADRVRQMYDALTAARLARRTVRVVSIVEDIGDMIITRVACSRGKSDGTGATFHVELRKIRTVRSATVDAPSPTEARGMLPSAQGSKGTIPAPPAVAAKADSIALGISKTLGFQK